MKRSVHAEILVATPGRLVDLTSAAPSTSSVQFLILDEADRMLDMGFKPVVDKLVGMTPGRSPDAAVLSNARRSDRAESPRRLPPIPSATSTLTPLRTRRFGASLSSAVEHAHKTRFVITELKNPDRGRTLVFVRTKRGADRLAKKLSSSKIKVAAMHGNKSQNQRERALAQFEDGRVDTLVATDVAARGIDVAGVTHVINFDAPLPRRTTSTVSVVRLRAGASGHRHHYVMNDQGPRRHQVRGSARAA